MQETWEARWKDYYQILQVQPSANMEVINDSFEKLARKYHPDLNKDTASLNQMKDLNVAFEVLSNPAKKAAYDYKYNKINQRADKNINCPCSNQVKKQTNPPHDAKQSICIRKWVPCPRCINGNMYPGHDGEYICLQCGYCSYPGAVIMWAWHRFMDSSNSNQRSSATYPCLAIITVLLGFIAKIHGVAFG
jgi:hypothetical protein